MLPPRARSPPDRVAWTGGRPLGAVEGPAPPGGCRPTSETAPRTGGRWDMAAGLTAPSLGGSGRINVALSPRLLGESLLLPVLPREGTRLDDDPEGWERMRTLLRLYRLGDVFPGPAGLEDRAVAAEAILEAPTGPGPAGGAHPEVGPPGSISGRVRLGDGGRWSRRPSRRSSSRWRPAARRGLPPGRSMCGPAGHRKPLLPRAPRRSTSPSARPFRRWGRRCWRCRPTWAPPASGSRPAARHWTCDGPRCPAGEEGHVSFGSGAGGHSSSVQANRPMLRSPALPTSWCVCATGICPAPLFDTTRVRADRGCCGSSTASLWVSAAVVCQASGAEEGGECQAGLLPYLARAAGASAPAAEEEGRLVASADVRA